MDALSPFALISLLYLVLGARVVYQLLRTWRSVFDRNFTASDRTLVDQAAFFVLVPISVAFHELGHAVVIVAFGGEVSSWGYFGFAGFVAYDPRGFSASEQIAVAAAGTVVNLVLAAGALALVFLRRPPMRSAFNELLIQFVVVSLLNALIVYPALDVLTGLNGDWSQMYDGGVPGLSLAILVIHVAILGGMWLAWRSSSVREKVAALTGGSVVRRVRPRPRRRQVRSTAATGSPEEVLLEAAERVAGGWPVPVEAGVQPTANGVLLVLSWQGMGVQRAVLARIVGGRLDLSGVAAAAGDRQGVRRSLGEPVPVPDADRLTLSLRLAMETVERWSPLAA